MRLFLRYCANGRYFTDKDFHLECSPHRVEGHVVLAHELYQFYILRAVPPLLPGVRVGGRDADVANRSVKPDIEDLHRIMRNLDPEEGC